MEAKQITVYVENKVGALADVSEMLGGAGVNILGISAQAIGNEGIIRVVTSDPQTAQNLLSKKYKTEMEDVVVFEVIDKPGELGKLARKIARLGANITSIYSIEKGRGKAKLAVAGDVEKFRLLLK